MVSLVWYTVLSLIPKTGRFRNERSSLVLFVSAKGAEAELDLSRCRIRHRGRADRASQAEVSVSQRRDLFPAVLAIEEVVRRPWHRIRADDFRLHHQSGRRLS